MNSIRCKCGSDYQITPQYYGTQFACAKCGAIVSVPVPSAASLPPPRSHLGPQAGSSPLQPVRPAGGTIDTTFRYLIKQKRLAINESYFIRDEAQNLLLYAFRPIAFIKRMIQVLAIVVGLLLTAFLAIGAAVSLQTTSPELGAIIAFIIGIFGTVGSIVAGIFLAPLRHTMFYGDEARTNLQFEVLQLERFQFPYANYTVRTADGTVLARLRQHMIWAILRKRWEIYNPDGMLVCVAREDSWEKALLRRWLGPMFGLLRMHFIFVPGDGLDQNSIGDFTRDFSIFDSYVLDMTGDLHGLLDRRVALAQAIMLDTGERR